MHKSVSQYFLTTLSIPFNKQIQTIPKMDEDVKHMTKLAVGESRCASSQHMKTDF